MAGGGVVLRKYGKETLDTVVSASLLQLKSFWPVGDNQLFCFWHCTVPVRPCTHAIPVISGLFSASVKCRLQMAAARSPETSVSKKRTLPFEEDPPEKSENRRQCTLGHDGQPEYTAG